MGDPQNGWFIVDSNIKMDDLGVPLFRKPPYGSMFAICKTFTKISTVAAMAPLSVLSFRRWWLRPSTPSQEYGTAVSNPTNMITYTMYLNMQLWLQDNTRLRKVWLNRMSPGPVQHPEATFISGVVIELAGVIWPWCGWGPGESGNFHCHSITVVVQELRPKIRPELCPPWFFRI